MAISKWHVKGTFVTLLCNKPSWSCLKYNLSDVLGELLVSQKF